MRLPPLPEAEPQHLHPVLTTLQRLYLLAHSRVNKFVQEMRCKMGHCMRIVGCPSSYLCPRCASVVYMYGYLEWGLMWGRGCGAGGCGSLSSGSRRWCLRPSRPTAGQMTCACPSPLVIFLITLPYDNLSTAPLVHNNDQTSPMHQNLRIAHSKKGCYCEQWETVSLAVLVQLWL